jgi:putative endonuclease
MVSKIFIVYMLSNRKNGAIYTGVTSNPVGRIWQHKTKFFEGFTKRYGIDRLVWYEVHDNAEAAITREKQIKEWKRPWKINRIRERNSEWRDLYAELTGEA